MRTISKPESISEDLLLSVGAGNQDNSSPINVYIVGNEDVVYGKVGVTIPVNQDMEINVSVIGDNYNGATGAGISVIYHI